mmetsp:Transcript_2235/g.3382  ORF Transcript_2235/g.3382 Transcript_2235/m.3382 type:complete len:219 (+) Transcript_2235:1617-2273(+)
MPNLGLLQGGGLGLNNLLASNPSLPQGSFNLDPKNGEGSGSKLDIPRPPKREIKSFHRKRDSIKLENDISPKETNNRDTPSPNFMEFSNIGALLGSGHIGPTTARRKQTLDGSQISIMDQEANRREMNRKMSGIYRGPEEDAASIRSNNQFTTMSNYMKSPNLFNQDTTPNQFGERRTRKLSTFSHLGRDRMNSIAVKRYDSKFYDSRLSQMDHEEPD